MSTSVENYATGNKSVLYDGYYTDYLREVRVAQIAILLINEHRRRGGWEIYELSTPNF